MHKLKYVLKCVALIARMAIFLSISVELLISQMESVRTIRHLNSSLSLIKIMKFLDEKMKKEKLGHIENHVSSR